LPAELCRAAPGCGGCCGAASESRAGGTRVLWGRTRSPIPARSAGTTRWADARGCGGLGCGLGSFYAPELFFFSFYASVASESPRSHLRPGLSPAGLSAISVAMDALGLWSAPQQNPSRGRESGGVCAHGAGVCPCGRALGPACVGTPRAGEGGTREGVGCEAFASAPPISQNVTAALNEQRGCFRRPPLLKLTLAVPCHSLAAVYL